MVVIDVVEGGIGISTSLSLAPPSQLRIICFPNKTSKPSTMASLAFRQAPSRLT